MSALPVLAWAFALAVMLVAPAARAQDFIAPAPADAVVASASPAAALEQGWPTAEDGFALAGVATSWYALPGFATRAVALGGGWRALRVAAGVAQTGDPDIGWNAGGLALGWGSARGGAALRAVARRDRIPPSPDAAPGVSTGAELGAGAWLTTPGGMALWASAPQVGRSGMAAPLERPLVVGVSYGGADARAWVARGAPVTRDPGGGGNLAGLALRHGPLSAWLEARDRPLRGTLGLNARAGAFEVAASIESHPVLGETARLALTARRGGGARAEER